MTLHEALEHMLSIGLVKASAGETIRYEPPLEPDSRWPSVVIDWTAKCQLGAPVVLEWSLRGPTAEILVLIAALREECSFEFTGEVKGRTT